MMKILLLSSSDNDPNSGASRVYLLLAEGLRERGRHVTLIHLNEMKLPKSFFLRKIAAKINLPYYLKKAARKLENIQDFDIVMASSGQGYKLFQDIRRKPGPRSLLINHIHGLALYDDLAARSMSWLGFWPVSTTYKYITGCLHANQDFYGVEAADLTIVQNYRDESFIAWRYPRSKLNYIPPCLHPSLLDASFQIKPISDRPNRILWFGSWERRKGAFLLPDIFKSVLNCIPDVDLIIGGTGKKPEEILASFEESVRSRIKVLDRISIEEQINYFNSAPIFLFPSWSEGFGLAVLEAMAFGCCAISTNTGGVIADYGQDRFNAMIVYPSVHHLSSAIVTILTQPELKARVSANGRELARSFTCEKMVDRYDDLFTKLFKGESY